MPLAVASAAAGLVLLAGVLIAAPAIGSAGDDDNGGQPPPGTSVSHTDPGPVITQPPPGTSIATTQEQPAIVQPANPHPDLKGKPTQLKDDEPNARHYPNQVDEGTATSGADQGD